MTNVIYTKETAPVGEPQLGTFSMKEDKDNGYTVPFVRVDSDNEAIDLVEAKKNFEKALLGLLKATNSPYAEALFNDHKDNLFYIANPIGVDSPIVHDCDTEDIDFLIQRYNHLREDSPCKPRLKRLIEVMQLAQKIHNLEQEKD